MGYDATCNCTLGKQIGQGQAQLETDFIQFRSSEFRFKVLLKDLAEVKPSGEFLELKFESKKARLELGQKIAARWADKILNPPGRLDKLGVKPASTVCLEGEFDPVFTRELGPRTGTLDEVDLIFLAVADKAGLLQISALTRRMRLDAALWIVYPKGRTEIREMDVLTAGRAAGLKDVKVVRFSDSHTALKFVVPLDARKRG